MQNTVHWSHVAFVLWLSQCGVLVTANMLNFALIWQLSQHASAAIALSTAGALSLIPGVVLAPLTGWVVDRYARRSIMIAAEVWSLVPLGVTWYWHATAAPWVIYVIVVSRAIGTTFYMTAWQATWPQIIPAAYLQRLSSMPQIVMGVASLLTPICGAAIVASQQWDGAILLALLALMVSTIVTWWLIPLDNISDMTPSWWHDWQHVWGVFQARSGLFGVLGVALLLNCVIMPVFSLLPYVITTHIHAGPWVLATSEIIGGIGLVCGVAILVWWGGFPHVIHTLLSAVVLLGVAFGAVALLPAQAWVVYGFVFGLGWAGAWLQGPLLTLVQANVPASMHGRAMAVLNATMNIATPVGIMGAGYLVAWYGVRWWAGMVAILIGATLVWVVNSAVMSLKGVPYESV